ncbi:MAG: hypothetical protein IRZ00_09555, partial [Gemmatimonadetes bacterium]|nr:hypothetical protein [Gemmatimonadota bacterium]
MIPSSRRGAARGRVAVAVAVREPWAWALLLALAGLVGGARPAAAQAERRGGPPGPPVADSAHVLKFRYMGPPSGGRVAAVA